MPDQQRLEVAGQQLVERISRVMAKVDWDSFVSLANMLPRARCTFVTGAGRSGLVEQVREEESALKEETPAADAEAIP